MCQLKYSKYFQKETFVSRIINIKTYVFVQFKAAPLPQLEKSSLNGIDFHEENKISVLFINR